MLFDCVAVLPNENDGAVDAVDCVVANCVAGVAPNENPVDVGADDAAGFEAPKLNGVDVLEADDCCVLAGVAPNESDGWVVDDDEAAEPNEKLGADDWVVDAPVYIYIYLSIDIIC